MQDLRGTRRRGAFPTLGQGSSATQRAQLSAKRGFFSNEVEEAGKARPTEREGTDRRADALSLLGDVVHKPVARRGGLCKTSAGGAARARRVGAVDDRNKGGNPIEGIALRHDSGDRERGEEELSREHVDGEGEESGHVPHLIVQRYVH